MLKSQLLSALLSDKVTSFYCGAEVSLKSIAAQGYGSGTEIRFQESSVEWGEWDNDPESQDINEVNCGEEHVLCDAGEDGFFGFLCDDGVLVIEIVEIP